MSVARVLAVSLAAAAALRPWDASAQVAGAGLAGESHYVIVWAGASTEAAAREATADWEKAKAALARFFTLPAGYPRLDDIPGAGAAKPRRALLLGACT